MGCAVTAAAFAAAAAAADVRVLLWWCTAVQQHRDLPLTKRRNVELFIVLACCCDSAAAVPAISNSIFFTAVQSVQHIRQKCDVPDLQFTLCLHAGRYVQQCRLFFPSCQRPRSSSQHTLARYKRAERSANTTPLEGKQVDILMVFAASLPARALTVPDVVRLCLELGVSFPLGRGDAGSSDAGSSNHNRNRDHRRRGAAALPRARRRCVVLIHLRAVRSAAAAAASDPIFGAGAVGGGGGSGRRGSGRAGGNGQRGGGGGDSVRVGYRLCSCRQYVHGILFVVVAVVVAMVVGIDSVDARR